MANMGLKMRRLLLFACRDLRRSTSTGLACNPNASLHKVSDKSEMGDGQGGAIGSWDPMTCRDGMALYSRTWRPLAQGFFTAG